MTHTEAARAKINLTLHVGRKIAEQSDPFYGFHPLDSLVVFSDFGDVLSCEIADETTLILSGPFADDLDSGHSNLVLKAYAITERAAGCPPLAFHLVKNLPVAAGIGGGSANAAAALRLLKHYIDLPKKTWRDIALKIGSDVPVCLGSQTARMTGTGETVTPLPGLGALHAVLVNPGAAVMTGEIFRSYDSGEVRGTPRPQMDAGGLLARALDGRNDLETPAIAAAPTIRTVLDTLAETEGCQLARMSGSGATCFGLYETATAAKNAAAQISSGIPAWWVQAVRLGESE